MEEDAGAIISSDHTNSKYKTQSKTLKFRQTADKEINSSKTHRRKLEHFQLIIFLGISFCTTESLSGIIKRGMLIIYEAEMSPISKQPV